MDDWTYTYIATGLKRDLNSRNKCMDKRAVSHLLHDHFVTAEVISEQRPINCKNNSKYIENTITKQNFLTMNQKARNRSINMVNIKYINKKRKQEPYCTLCSMDDWTYKN
jgi:hypothetical protein